MIFTILLLLSTATCVHAKAASNSFKRKTDSQVMDGMLKVRGPDPDTQCRFFAAYPTLTSYCDDGTMTFNLVVDVIER